MTDKHPVYRLYIDETGNSDLASSENPNHRFLSLTGVIIEFAYIKTILFKELEQLKSKYFQSHPDDPVILHRAEMVNKKPPFQVLRDEFIEQSFNTELLECLEKWNYTVITVLIDKLEHKEKYKTWRYDPYHYCLEVLIERYVMFLEAYGKSGDTLAESRGGQADLRLKDSYGRLWESGTGFIKPERFQNCLTSCQLKIKNKTNNISGLQLADILAHPSRREILAEEGLTTTSSEQMVFGDRIIRILQNKYYSLKPDGVKGYGKKKLP